MATKIIKQPTPLFRMTCDKCECVFEYTFLDLNLFSDTIYCPCCDKVLAHNNREKYCESEDTE